MPVMCSAWPSCFPPSGSMQDRRAAKRRLGRISRLSSYLPPRVDLTLILLSSICLAPANIVNILTPHGSGDNSCQSKSQQPTPLMRNEVIDTKFGLLASLSALTPALMCFGLAGFQRHPFRMRKEHTHFIGIMYEYVLRGKSCFERVHPIELSHGNKLASDPFSCCRKSNKNATGRMDVAPLDFWRPCCHFGYLVAARKFNRQANRDWVFTTAAVWREGYWVATFRPYSASKFIDRASS